jgi:hypothetical protein
MGYATGASETARSPAGTWMGTLQVAAASGGPIDDDALAQGRCCTLANANPGI